jgi:hypothetical protein
MGTAQMWPRPNGTGESRPCSGFCAPNRVKDQLASETTHRTSMAHSAPSPLPRSPQPLGVVPNPDSGRPMLSPKNAAAQLLTTVANLAQLRYQSRGPAYVKLGRSVAYLQSDLDTYIMLNRTVPSRG